MDMGAHRETILIVDESGELALRLEGAMPDRQVVKCARSGDDALAVITTLHFDVIVLHHPAPEALEATVLPTLSKLADPPRLLVIAARGECSSIAARFGVMCVSEPADPDAIVAAIDLVRDRDLRVDRP